MSEIPIFTLASATYISTNDHLERADSSPLGNPIFRHR